MPVRKRGDAWHIDIQVGGQRIRCTAGKGATRAQALALESRLRADHLAGRLGRAPKRSIDEALARWLTGEAARLKSHANILDKARAIRPAIAGRALTEIVQAAEQVKADGIAAGLAAATINRRIAILRRIAHLAHDAWGWLDQPLGAKIKLLPGERARHVYLTATEVEALAAAAAPPAVADAIRLAAYSGMRRREVLTASGIVDGCAVLPDTKSGRPRLVPLPPGAAIHLPLGIGDHALRKGFEAARAAIGRPDLRFHDLRHTAASFLVRAGVGLTVVRDLLGHANLAVTSRYAHLATDDLKAALAASQKRHKTAR